jgi:hypothetical protein
VASCLPDAGVPSRTDECSTACEIFSWVVQQMLQNCHRLYSKAMCRRWCGAVESKLEKISRDSFSSESPISRNLKSTIHIETFKRSKRNCNVHTIIPSTSRRRGWKIDQLLMLSRSIRGRGRVGSLARDTSFWDWPCRVLRKQSAYYCKVSSEAGDYE